MKRSSGTDDSSSSKKQATDEEEQLIVYSPSIVPPELKSRVNSLVEVLLPPRYLVADHKQARASLTRLRTAHSCRQSHPLLPQ